MLCGGIANRISQQGLRVLIVHVILDDGEVLLSLRAQLQPRVLVSEAHHTHVQRPAKHTHRASSSARTHKQHQQQTRWSRRSNAAFRGAIRPDVVVSKRQKVMLHLCNKTIREETTASRTLKKTKKTKQSTAKARDA